MTVTVTGATGFLGRRVVEALRQDGHTVVALSRRTNVAFGPNVAVVYWDPMAGLPPDESLLRVDAVVHLAGEPVAQRWTPEVKRRIRDSRVLGTRNLVRAIAAVRRPPATLICASAVGYYGFRGDEILTEQSSPGQGFLPEVCVAWEQAANEAAGAGLRVVNLRIGVVLGDGGGALEKMLPAFRAGVGGRLGSGRQWMSWIHADDVVGLIRHALAQPLRGPVNAVAPVPVTNAEFTRELAAVLRRPALFPAPAFAVRALFGEMAQIVLGSQRVLPAAAESSGYSFAYRELGPALRAIFWP